MNTLKYRITCLKCGADRIVGIAESAQGDIIDWLDNDPNPFTVKIYSGRKRLDGNFGWECICGNNDIMTEQEKKFISNKQDPSLSEISDIVNNLQLQKPQFTMERI